MKKLMVISLVMFLIAGVSALSFAQTAGAKKTEAAVDIVRGTVVSVDTAKNAIVVKENKTGESKTIVVDASIIPTLKAGDHVKATLKAGSNAAESVKIAVTNKKASVKWVRLCGRGTFRDAKKFDSRAGTVYIISKCQ